MTYKNFAISVAKQSGKIIRANFKFGMKKSWKANDTPVTITDTKINSLVIAAVKKNFPTHDVLGEEESSRKNNSKYLWVCDPVDGTIPFSHGIPTCVFSLALVIDGRPVLGVIYDPFFDRMVYAELGKGAFLNGKRIRVNKQYMDHSTVCWCSHRLALPLMKKYPNCFAINFYSYIYGVMLVAVGEFSASLYTGSYAHDTVSGKIIVEEAGGKVTDLNGKDQRYDGPVHGCLVSNGLVHNELVKITKTHEAAKSFKSPHIY